MFGASDQAFWKSVSASPALLLNSSKFIGFTVSASTHDFATSGLTWAAGDYVLSLFGHTHTGTQLSSVAGLTNDTFALIRAQDGFNFEPIYSHEGTINGGALDATVRYTVVSRRAVAALLIFRGVLGAASQPNVENGASGSSASPESPSITTTVAGCTLISVFGTYGTHNLAQVNAAVPAGYTLVGSANTGAAAVSSTSYNTLAAAYKVQAAAGATGVAQWTNAMGESHNWNAMHIAIAPS